MKKGIIFLSISFYTFFTFAQNLTFPFEGLQRESLVHQPLNYNGTDTIPLLIALHNAYGSAGEFEAMTKLSVKADSFNFMVVYPNGTGSPKFWNAGGECCGSAKDENINDVGFISSLIDTICKSYHIDTNKIYAAGFSNGSILAYRLAVELSDKISGIAAASGQMMVDSIHPSKPVSIIHFHNLDDTAVPFDGGEGSGMTFPSVDSVIQTWKIINDCEESYEVIYEKDGVIGKKWASNKNADIIVYTKPTGGHTWSNTPISATDLLIDFFQLKNAPGLSTTINRDATIYFNEGHQELLTCYPNPMNHSATVSFVSNQDQHIQLNIYNMNGQLIYNLYSGRANTGAINIPIEINLNQGLYFLYLAGDQLNGITKIIVLP